MFEKIYYERRLPHWIPPGETLFLTYRLKNSLPVSTIKMLQALTEQDLQMLTKYANNPNLGKLEYHRIQNTYFRRLDEVLDGQLNEPHWLKAPPIAQVVWDSWMHLNEHEIDLLALTIMSNHVHVLFKHREGGRSIVEIMKSHKGFTARQANKLLGRTGHAFWQEESYDHLVRSSHEEQRIVQYIINNPVKAGLVKTWKDWSWTYTSALSQ